MTDKPYADPLAGAESAASQFADTPAASPVQPCPLDRKALLELVVVGEDDVGLENIGVELVNAGGLVLRARTGAQGAVRFEGLDPGSYRAGLHELDETAWAPLDQAPLSPAMNNAAPAPWQAAPAETQATVTHVVEPGECMAALAERYGFHPDRLWNLPANAALLDRLGSMYTLYAGDSAVAADRVVIPPRAPKTIAVQTGQRYRLRRHAVPELLHIAFEEYGIARAGVAYLIDITGPDGSRWAAHEGRTDDDGALREAIPPGARHATVTLLLTPEARTYEFRLGYLDPPASLAGVQDMLENLGYPCAAERGSMGPLTRAALKGFRLEHGLPDADALDTKTREKIYEVYAS